MPRNGTQIGHYKILSAIGAGGMGEVFLAEDSRLNRKVALKVLPEIVAADFERLRRFEQEARAASALNHPNILTVFEFGFESGTHFLATELIEGETLRETIKGGELQLTDTLKIAEQVAFALSAAHTAGIVHRDLKPENIMIRRDGIVKVLDFGLAKLIEKKQAIPDMEAETLALVKTAPGIIMGTVAYMPPEQARGKNTDARSDIWSLGCVLYEMIAGKTPFAGETAADIIAAIINRNPTPLTVSQKSISARLEEIISKCLEKNPEERYQTAKDLLNDIRRLKKRLEFESESERSAEHYDIGGQTTDEQAENKTQMLNATTGAAEMQTHSVSSAEYITGEIKRHKLLTFGVAALLVLTGIGFAIYKYSAFFSPAAIRFASPQNLKFTRLISGQISNAKISPDGRYAAYTTSDGGGKNSIRLRQIATATDVEIVAPVSGLLFGLNFTPDGDHLYYINYVPPQNSVIYRVSTLGGSPVKIADKSAYSNTAVSPDGKTIAYIGADSVAKESSLLLANADGSNERTLVKLTDSSSFGNPLAWSPDGKTVAANIETISNAERNLQTFGISVADGSRRLLSEQEWGLIPNYVWLPDGNLIGNGYKKSADTKTPKQLWRITPADAALPPQSVTNDFNDYTGISATAKGDVLLATTFRNIGNLWISPSGDAARAVQIPSSGEVYLINWTPDNKFLYTSKTNDVWTMNADGTNQRQLTANQGENLHPSMTPDLRYIVFMSNRESGIHHIYRMDADGRNQTQLTSGPGEWWARLSPDGRWIYYAALTSENEPSTICRIPIDGGEPSIIAKIPGGVPGFDISPRDGTIAYRQTGKEQGKTVVKVHIIPPDGGEPLTTLTIPPTAVSLLRWTPDGRAVAFIDSRNNSANLWAVSLDGKGEAKPLTDFKTDSLQVSFAWSPDGKQLAVIRGTRITDAVLITETK